MYRLTGINLLSFLLLFLVLMPLSVNAELLRIDVPAEERSEEAEAEAVTQAFAEAVVQLTGDAQAAEDKDLMEKLGDPQLYLNSYYDQPAEEGQEGWVYVVEFERELLSARLAPEQAAEESLPTEALPDASDDSVLVWMLVEQQLGDVFLLSRDTHLELAADLRQWLADAPGKWSVPPQSAIGSAGVSMASVLNRDTRTLARVSEALGFKRSMAVVLTELGPASWLAKASEVGSDAADQLGDAGSYSEALNIALGTSGRNEASESDSSDGNSAQPELSDDVSTFTIAVSNIKGYSDFSRITNYLGSLPNVASWAPRGSQAGVAMFEVSINGGHAAFIAAMTEAEDALFSPDEASHSGAGSDAHYRFRLK